MRTVLNLFLFIVLLLCFSIESFGKNDDLSSELLIGFWRSVQASQGGLTSVIEFRNNGVMINVLAVMEEYNYELTDNVLTVMSVSTEKRIVHKIYTMKMLGKECHLEDDHGNSIILVNRDDRNQGEAPSIIGKWSFKHQTGATGFYVFKPDGRFLIQVPMPGATVSQFSVRKNEITITRENIPPSTIKYKISRNDLLILTTENDQEEWKYRRIKR